MIRVGCCLAGHAVSDMGLVTVLQDMPSLIKAPPPGSTSTLLLVSSGARMLRVKKAVFRRLASPQAMEHTRTMVSKQP